LRWGRGEGDLQRSGSCQLVELFCKWSGGLEWCFVLVALGLEREGGDGTRPLLSLWEEGRPKVILDE
jgi:hypothetical protein